ncbi:hypothetical protein AMECASPLE_027601 [Ameca splendens]|uniref:Uncharacterized protein n=1 Tax=Ameca splendens TaxID=208324 RepID=A0ABV0YGE3_9TELE
MTMIALQVEQMELIAERRAGEEAGRRARIITRPRRGRGFGSRTGMHNMARRPHVPFFMPFFHKEASPFLYRHYRPPRFLHRPGWFLEL